jgi:hypothetical protein
MKKEEKYTLWEPRQVRKNTNHLWFVSRVLPLPPVADNRSVETTRSHLRTLLMSLHQYLAHAMFLMTRTMYLDSAPPCAIRFRRRSRFIHLPRIQKQAGGGSSLRFGVISASSISLTRTSELGVDLMVFRSRSHILHESYRRRVYVVSTLFPHPPSLHVSLRRT